MRNKDPTQSKENQSPRCMDVNFTVDEVYDAQGKHTFINLTFECKNTNFDPGISPKYDGKNWVLKEVSCADMDYGLSNNIAMAVGLMSGLFLHDAGMSYTSIFVVR